jgi:hypothetical protein
LYHFKLLKPVGYGMPQQVEYFNNCTLCPYCICVLYLSKNKQRLATQIKKKLIGFYNQDEKCLRRGAVWTFK